MRMILTAGVLCGALLLAAVSAVHAKSPDGLAPPSPASTTLTGE